MSKLAHQLGLVFRSWPIRPVPVTVLLTLFQLLVNFAVLAATARENNELVTPIQAAATLPSLVLGFGLSLVVLQGLKLLSEWRSGLGPWAYWLGATLYGSALAFVRFATTNDQTPDYWEEPITLVRIFVVGVLLYFTAHISLGVSSLKLAEQYSEAQAAKASLEQQRGRLIAAQEDVRRQIADFLHDRLQSDLVLLGMQMQKSIERLGDQEKAIAQAYIDEIERIRQFDVRDISKQLSPELEGPTFRPAIEDLAGRYSKVLRVTLSVEERGKLSQAHKLACYRIVEQALLNAAQHASAKSVQVSILEGDSHLYIEVKNDGLAAPGTIVPGAGFAIIEDWVAQLGGQWSLQSSDGWTVASVSLTI